MDGGRSRLSRSYWRLGRSRACHASYNISQLLLAIGSLNDIKGALVERCSSNIRAGLRDGSNHGCLRKQLPNFGHKHDGFIKVIFQVDPDKFAAYFDRLLYSL